MFKFKQVALVAAVAAAAGSASANPISSAAEIGNAKVITFDAFDGLVIPNASNPVLQVGTEVGEVTRCVGARQHGRQVEHAEAGERGAGGSIGGDVVGHDAHARRIVGQRRSSIAKQRSSSPPSA